MSAERQPGSFAATLAAARNTMEFREIIRLAVDTFYASKVRFLLTMLGMVIGSASIIMVVTLGGAGKDYAISLIRSIGPNMIEMQYVGGNVTGPDNTASPDYMTRQDMDAVLEHNELGIVASSPMLEFHDRISMGGGATKDTMELGVSPQYKDVRNLVVTSGRFFDDQDTLQHAKVAVIVEPFAKELFGSDQAAVDKTIAIDGIPFTVIGVFRESIETFGMSEVSDQTILIPYPVARLFTGTETVKQIFFTVADSSQVRSAAARIRSIIQARHRSTTVYNAFTLNAVLEVMAKIASALTIVFTLAAFITLIVAGVGIMNSMLANVQARLREIGIRKALGATRREIRLQFLTEAVFLSLSGGIVGTFLGMATPPFVGFITPIIGRLFGQDVPAFNLPVSWIAAFVALGTSVAVGVIFGTVPANRAAALDPVETLKYE